MIYGDYYYGFMVYDYGSLGHFVTGIHIQNSKRVNRSTPDWF